MQQDSFYNEEFSKEFHDNDLAGCELEACVFKRCIFTNVNFSKTVFLDCEFVECEFVNASICMCAWRSVTFCDCKLQGMRFDLSNTFLLELHFDKCLLRYSSYYGLDLTKSSFNACDMRETEFIEANLSGLSLDDCDLQSAAFGQTNLSKTDFSNARGYQLNPDNNQVDQALFSREGLTGLVEHLNIIIKP